MDQSEQKTIKKDSVVINYILQSFYRILQIILPVITTPYISRVLTSSGVGEFTYVSSVSYFFGLAANMGIANYGNRVIAENCNNHEKLSRSFWNIYYCHFGVSLISIIAYVIFVKMFIKQYSELFLCEILTLLAAMFEITWFFTGLQQFRITVARSTIARLTSVALIFAFVKERTDVWKYIVILSGGQFISQLIVWSQVRKYVSFAKPDIKEIVGHLKPMIVLFVPLLATGLYRNMDKILLNQMCDSVQTGLYGSADRIINIPLSLITAIGVVSLPKLSELLSKKQTEEAINYIRLSMRFALWMASGIVFGLIGIAPVFVPVFFGPGYEGCIILMSTISITVLFVTWSDVIRSHFLIPKKKDNAYIISVFAGAGVNIIIDVLLIPSMQAIGAVIGTIVAEMIVAIVQSIYARDLPIKDMLAPCIPFIISGVIMCILVRIMGNLAGISALSLIIEISVGVVIYLIPTALYLYKKQDPLWKYLMIYVMRIKTKLLYH